jgi:hypothetical protein
LDLSRQKYVLKTNCIVNTLAFNNDVSSAEEEEEEAME